MDERMVERIDQEMKERTHAIMSEWMKEVASGLLPCGRFMLLAVHPTQLQGIASPQTSFYAHLQETWCKRCSQKATGFAMCSWGDGRLEWVRIFTLHLIGICYIYTAISG